VYSVRCVWWFGWVWFVVCGLCVGVVGVVCRVPRVSRVSRACCVWCECASVSVCSVCGVRVSGVWRAHCEWCARCVCVRLVSAVWAAWCVLCGVYSVRCVCVCLCLLTLLVQWCSCGVVGGCSDCAFWVFYCGGRWVCSMLCVLWLECVVRAVPESPAIACMGCFYERCFLSALVTDAFTISARCAPHHNRTTILLSINPAPFHQHRS
jgi:hypothetical protein